MGKSRKETCGESSTIAPGSSGVSWTRWPLTWRPLVLRRSAIHQTPLDMRISAWRREICEYGKTMSFVVSLPIVTLSDCRVNCWAPSGVVISMLVIPSYLPPATVRSHGLPVVSAHIR